MSSLLVKGILVEKIGAVKLLAVSLVEGDYIFLSLEYFNLGKYLNLKILVLINKEMQFDICLPHLRPQLHSW